MFSLINITTHWHQRYGYYSSNRLTRFFNKLTMFSPFPPPVRPSVRDVSKSMSRSTYALFTTTLVDPWNPRSIYLWIVYISIPTIFINKNRQIHLKNLLYLNEPLFFNLKTALTQTHERDYSTYCIFIDYFCTHPTSFMYIPITQPCAVVFMYGIFD